MKKFGAFLSLIGLLSQSSALAWVGGPYSNNTYDGLDGGTFAGTIRGPGATGIFKFNQDQQPYVSTFGDSIVYFKGLAYYGECYGQVDFDSGTVSGITNGASNGSNPNDQNQSPTYRSVFGTGFGVQNGLEAAGATGITAGADSQNRAANSAWNGKLASKKRAIRFQAKGEMSFFGNSTESTTIINTISGGDFNDPRSDEETGLISNPQIRNVTNPFPGNGTTSQTVKSENNFPDIKNSIKIRVYGSRVTTGSYTPAGYAG